MAERNSPSFLAYELAEKLKKHAELQEKYDRLDIETRDLGREILALAAELAPALDPDGQMVRTGPSYNPVTIEVWPDDGGVWCARLAPVANAHNLTWPAPVPATVADPDPDAAAWHTYTVNPDVPCDVAAQVAAALDDEVA